jgi:drug/metabolite transporter (DMT)-like permease
MLGIGSVFLDYGDQDLRCHQCAAGYRFRFYLNALLYVPASVVAPIWNTQPIISFFLARITLKGIEVVTFRDGIAAALSSESW